MALELTKMRLQGSIQAGGWMINASGYDLAEDIQPYNELLLYVRDNWDQVWDVGPEQLIKAYISQEQFKRNWETGEVSFHAHTSQWHLQTGWLLATWFKEVAGDETLHRRNDLNYSYIIRHLLEEHCNITEVAGLNIAGTGYTFGQITIDDCKFWDFLRDCARDEFRLVYVDRNNIINYVDHPGLESPAPSSRMRFTADHYYDARIVEYPQRCGYVRLTAATGGVGGEGELTAQYPLLGPDPEGEQRTVDNLRITELAALQTLAQRVYEWENRVYSVRFKTWLNHYVDIGDVISIDLVDATNGYDWDDKKFLVINMSFTLDLNNVKWETIITAEELPND